jgi:putative ABC transport system substrate-binding protein
VLVTKPRPVASTGGPERLSQSAPCAICVLRFPAAAFAQQQQREPGGNVTGISVLFNVVVKKQVEMLSEMAPTAGLIDFLVNPANSNAGSDTQDAEEAALALGRRMFVVRASSEGEIEAAFGTLIEQQAGALLVAADVFLTAT